jgi:transcriptional regulator with XRE-family HTH domain
MQQRGEGMSTTVEKRQLEEIRKARKLTRPQLAEMLGVSQVTIFSWERQRSRPRQDVYERLLDVLQVDTDDLDLEPWVITDEHREAMAEGFREGWRRRKEAQAREVVAV